MLPSVLVTVKVNTGVSRLMVERTAVRLPVGSACTCRRRVRSDVVREIVDDQRRRLVGRDRDDGAADRRALVVEHGRVHRRRGDVLRRRGRRCRRRQLAAMPRPGRRSARSGRPSAAGRRHRFRRFGLHQRRTGDRIDRVAEIDPAGEDGRAAAPVPVCRRIHR